MRTKKQLELTPEAWDHLLAFLGPTEEVAGARYEDVRRRLIRFFTCKGCSDFEYLVDKTFDRVAKKCKEEHLADSYVGDPLLYFYTVARYVFLEFVKKRPPRPSMPAPDPPEVKEARHHCLHRCMDSRLKNTEIRMILEYYRGERASKIKQRKDLAALLGTNEKTLRVKAHRIRNKLRDCVSECLKQKGLI